jgi:transcriptional regulator with XRE-family HTH domain
MQTGIEQLFMQTQDASPLMPSVCSDLLKNFTSSKEYRHAFVEEKVRTQLAIQTKTIREQREMSRPAFAKLMDKANSWVFRLEDPNQPPPTIPTLLKVAEAFDVDLEISFRPFSHLLNRLRNLQADGFGVPSFEDEVRENTFGSKTHEEMSALWSQLQRDKNAGANDILLFWKDESVNPQPLGADLLEMPKSKPPQSANVRCTRRQRVKRA